VHQCNFDSKRFETNIRVKRRIAKKVTHYSESGKSCQTYSLPIRSTAGSPKRSSDRVGDRVPSPGPDGFFSIAVKAGSRREFKAKAGTDLDSRNGNKSYEKPSKDCFIDTNRYQGHYLLH